MAVSLLVTGGLIVFGGPLFGLFTSDPEIIALGKQILLIEFVLEIGRSINIVMVRCLVAVGDVNFPVSLGIASMFVINPFSVSESSLSKKSLPKTRSTSSTSSSPSSIQLVGESCTMPFSSSSSCVN